MPFAIDNRLPSILDRLKCYQPVDRRRKTDPLRQLIFVVFADGVAPAVAMGLYRQLMNRYPRLSQLRDAATNDLCTLFVGLPGGDLKAAAIPALLQEIDRRCGELSLDLLRALSSEAAHRWLMGLPGVTDVMARAVLSFSTLDRPVIAIDQPTGRVVRRLGLCVDGAPLSALPRQIAERAPSSWSGHEFSELGAGLARLARQACKAGKPKCDLCPLSDLCPSAGQPAAPVLAFPLTHA